MTHGLRVNNLACLRQQQYVFSSVSFHVNAGEGLLVTGKNGAGKSSLLRLLAGIATPDAGSISYEIPFQQRHYLAHTSGLKLDLTVSENIKLEQLFLGEETPRLLDAVLADLQLTSLLNKQIRHLSAGQKQKLALSKLFLYPRKCWLLDEPLTSLDASAQTYFFEGLTLHLQQGGLVVMSSHQPLSLTTPLAVLAL